MSRLQFPSLVIVSLLLALPASADIYKWLDARGSVHVSNLQPEWWQENYADKSYTEIVAPAGTGSAGVSMSDGDLAQTYSFIGDGKTKLYHAFDCARIARREGDRLVLTIPSERRAYFHSAYSARRAGFAPDPSCQTGPAGAEPAVPPESEAGGQRAVPRGQEALFRSAGEPDLDTPDYGKERESDSDAQAKEKELARKKEMEKEAEERRLMEEKEAKEKERQAEEEKAGSE